MIRPEKDLYYITIANTVSKRSSCIKRKVGAIIVVEDSVVATGYNGTPRGTVNCNEGGCPRCKIAGAAEDYAKCFCAHAEENALIQAARTGMKVCGGVMFSLLSPCLPCSRMILNSGIAKLVYLNKWDEGEIPLSLLQDNGVEVLRLPIDAVVLS
jgi:dCMP deaminase